MAYYSRSSSYSSSDFHERIQERRDRMYPNTVPAHRRGKKISRFGSYNDRDERLKRGMQFPKY